MKKLLLLTVSILILSSCERYFEGVNENPNSPVLASVITVLPAVQVELADWYGGELARYTSMLTQQIEGVSRCGAYYYYTGLLPSEFSSMWINHYANILIELKYLKEESNKQEFHHFEAVANVLTAHQLMAATDIWNDIPWSEALQGLAIIKPKYDSQTAIYNDIDLLLGDAIALLNDQNGGLDIEGDLVYNGDVEKWKKLAYALQARAALHWGLQNASNYTTALTAIQQSFTSNDDDFALKFPGTSGNEAPMLRFFRDRTGHLEFDPGLRNRMNALNDTARLQLLDESFNEDHPFFTSNQELSILTYRELKFIEAECLLRTNGDASQIRAAYLEGIRASFEYFGVENEYQNFIQQTGVDPGIGNITLELIINQKYIALYAVPEAYNDWRRTDFPTLSPTSGQAIPLRFPYPETELSVNPNTPQINIYVQHVDWDDE